ncbi:MAG TPA: 50S ribosomal protein L9 [Candidatus Sulfomarinibacteraceae bacterium]|nr:50S ribosomal protein L9 [Candidatus Sulfomarinibacteraceae bacterium]
MKVILNDFIEHLGERGDSVEVKPGYARNYLLPKGLAYPDTPGSRRRFEQEQKKWEELDLSRRSAAEGLAKQLDGTKLLFERRAGEKDVLFGSVSVADIAKELADRGYDIDRRRILLEHPIKELGTTEVVVNVHRDFQVTLPVQVVRPGEEADAVGIEVTAEEVPAAVAAAESETGDSEPAPQPAAE